MAPKKDIDLLIKRIKSVTNLTQEGIAGRIKYSREYLSQAKKTNPEGLYALLEEHFKSELAAGYEPPIDDKLNPERALMLALLQDYAEWKAEATGVSFQDVKGELTKKAHLILDDLHSWLPELPEKKK